MKSVTEEFILPKGKMMQFLLLRHCLWLIMGLAVTGLIFIVVGIITDLRIAVIGLMIWCLFLPAILAFVIIRHAFKRTTAMNSLPHILSITDQGIDATYRIVDFNESEQEREKKYRTLNIHFPNERLGIREAFWQGTFIKILPDDGYLYVPVIHRSDNDVLIAGNHAD